MARDKNLKKPEGLCQKLHNAVTNPFRARIRRTSHHQPDQGSISNKKPASGNTPIVPVRAEFEPRTEREVEIVGRREKIAKSYTEKEKLSQWKNGDDLLHEKKFSGYVGKVNDSRVTRTASSVGRGGGGGGGGGGGRETSLMKDSLNDRIANYINRAKIRMRKTTSIGDDDRSSSLK
ncbi:hypothetical protein OROMI_029445 [Orobanche minor]